MFKKSIVLFSIAVVAILIFGCSTPTEPGTAREIVFYLSFIDQEGNDLLDPAFPTAITEQNTNLYYQSGDSLVKQFHGNLDSPKMFSIITDEQLKGRYFMKVFSNIIEDQETAFTYLEFEDYSMDTIKTEYVLTDNSTSVTKVWYNGDLKCNTYDKSNREMVIEDRVWCYITVTHNME